MYEFRTTPSSSTLMNRVALVRPRLFASCSVKELQHVAKAGTELTIAAGTTIIDQGQMGREAFVVMSGALTVKRNGKKVATLGVGSMVGELIGNSYMNAETIRVDGGIRMPPKSK